jgi:hypothetical protein
MKAHISVLENQQHPNSERTNIMACRRKSIWFVCVFITAALSFGSAFGQTSGTRTIPAGSGTLTYSWFTYTYNCISDFRRDTYYKTNYSGFSYTVSGTTVPLVGQTHTLDNTHVGYYGCPTSSYPPVTLYVPPIFPYSIQDVITFRPWGEYDGTATMGSLTPGIIYPKYQVQSIIYDTPGNRSSNGFQNNESDGISTTVGNSFTQGETVTFSYGGFLGLGSTLSWSVGNSTTTGNSTADTETISQATGVLSVSNSSAPNSINHQQDLFIVWVNPAVVIYQAGPSGHAGYITGTQLQGPGDRSPGNPQDYQRQVEVTAQQMLPNANGRTTVDIQDLEPITIDNETLPGLAGMCANQAYYPNSCSADPNGQCGCTPSDFTTILAQDPLLNYGPTDSPLNADTSGANSCGVCPSPTASCRYVPVADGLNSCIPLFEYLKGPATQGGIIPTNQFTASDQNQKATTLSETYSHTVSNSVEQSFSLLGISLRDTNTWTWTDSESLGKINTNAHSMSVNFASSTVACDQLIEVFEDTVYHTFVFQQPQGDTSCP